MKKLFQFGVWVSVFFLLVGCSLKDKRMEVTISAAASLKDALQDIELLFENETGINVNVNLASSGTLSKQIEQGAPVDVFFSADHEKMDELVKKELIEQDSVVNLLENRLVIVVSPTLTIQSIKEVWDLERISIGTPETVPAGYYAKEVLTSLNKWDELRGKLIYAKDVRQVLSYVETNNVKAGIVYKTDSLVSDKVKVLDELDPSLYSKIIYPVAIVKNSQTNKEAVEFFQFLQSEEALEIFKKYGFRDYREIE
ncbi:molybdate ABC transporter substrate-binding protein [Metabacillus sp. HB246100]|uniref:molybdate ABC transporter substrate-binding protein n=1 Tax=Bacillus weihaiensis TaxID=1547283 RepID=UPI002356FA31|nr:molybdate ABC transporter substrate-binding protein [Bacillus weihaiensis]